MMDHSVSQACQTGSAASGSTTNWEERTISPQYDLCGSGSGATVSGACGSGITAASSCYLGNATAPGDGCAMGDSNTDTPGIQYWGTGACNNGDIPAAAPGSGQSCWDGSGPV